MMLWLVVCVLLAVLAFRKLHPSHVYWKNLGIKHVPSIPLFGNSFKFIVNRETLHVFMRRIYASFPDERYCGFHMLTTPMVMVSNPELIRRIAVKDFDHFTDRLALTVDDNEPLFALNLFSLKGDMWRKMRSTLSPAFTNVKMKAMYNLMVETAEQFTDYLLANGSSDLEMKNIFNRYGTDVIANCAFGVKCDSMADVDNDFYRMGLRIDPSRSNNKVFFMSMAPRICKLLGVRIFPDEVLDYFRNLVRGSIETRERQKIVRPDMIHLLMEARKGELNHDESQAASSNETTGFATVEESEYGKSTDRMELTLDVMTAQALIFFFAGFESGSLLMSFLCYELAVNPDVQERLRNEVDEALGKCDGAIGYEALNRMSYLDMVISETLRKWPAAGAVVRECVKPYTIPPSNPGEKPLHLKKGDCTWFAVYAMHHDPDYYPDPERFDPERFGEENRSTISPYTFMPFGVGPRNCIGSRFAVLAAKTITVRLLSKFEIVPNGRTEIPIQLKKGGVNLYAENGIRLNFKRRALH